MSYDIFPDFTQYDNLCFIHVAANDFISMILRLSIIFHFIYVPHHFLIHYSVNGHLDCKEDCCLTRVLNHFLTWWPSVAI